MKREIYIIVNYDSAEIEYASENYTNVQEVLYDSYMENLYYEFLWHVNYEGKTAAEAYQEAVELVQPWFRNYIIVEKVVLD